MPNVLICGSTLVANPDLIQLLQKKSTLTLLTDSSALSHEVKIHQIDLVLLELKHGIEADLTELARLTADFQSVKVIVVDGNNSNMAVVNSFKCGADDYFRKPIDPVLLAERVEALLKKKYSSQTHQDVKLPS
jgi:DNA-binding response OmpR family regulator